MKNITLIVLAIFLTGCATMVRGTEEQVSVNTTPPGADIQFSNGQSCISPCTIPAKRSDSLQVTAKKKGCQSQTATLLPKLGSAMLIGGLMDYSSGAVYDLQPNPLYMTLQCKNAN